MSNVPDYSASDAARCRELVNYADYPIDEPSNPTRATVIDGCRTALADDGCAVLKSFLSETGTRTLLDEALQRRERAYFSPATTANVYFSSDDPALPDEHPRRMFLERSNGFITSDNFGGDTSARLLYYWPPLTRFIADCLDKHELYIYDDPVSTMIVNVGRPGTRFNWHFDTNEFTITMLLQPAGSGGHFEYVPNLRSADDENYAAVTGVLKGDTRRMVRLALEPGDLQLFLGRFSLHRVTENTGQHDRLLLIMSFAEEPGMIGSVHRVRTLYGKVTEAHLQAERERVRNDSLLD